jgi:peptidoglycan/LPS O-acetylase OafA/YrhL
MDQGTNRYYALDGLRGLAALSIVVYHITFPNHFTKATFFTNSYLAVDLFFVISGFVIAANYSQAIQNDADLSKFIYLRLFRLYPMFCTVLFVLVAVELVKLAGVRAGLFSTNRTPFSGSYGVAALLTNVLLAHGLPHWRGLVGFIQFAGPFGLAVMVSVVQKRTILVAVTVFIGAGYCAAWLNPSNLDWPWDGSFSWNGPSWTVSCEFIAYSIFAFMIVGRYTNNTLAAAVAFLAVFCYIFLAAAYGTLDLPRLGLFRCLSGFFLGTLVYKFSGQFEAVLGRSSSSIWACELGVTVAAILTMSTISGAAVLVIVPIFVLAVAVFQMDRGPIAQVLASQPLQLLGRISYSVYLVHGLVLMILGMALKRILVSPPVGELSPELTGLNMSPWLGDALVIGTLFSVIAISMATCVTVEEPARRYGRRLFGGASGPALSATAPSDGRGAEQPAPRAGAL